MIKYKKIILSMFAIGSIVTTPLIVSCSSVETLNNVNLSIISTNDIHGRLESNDKNGEAGLQALSGWLKTQKYDLLLDGGDLTQGTSLSDTDKGHTIAKVEKLMGYDAIAVGNHEFDFGAENILNIIKNVNDNFISANVRYEANNQRLFTATKIKQLQNGLKVGIIGLTTLETKYKTHPKNVTGIKFTSLLEETKKEIANLKQQNINFIVVVCHVGQDDTKPLAEQLNDDIDLIVDGHSHEDVNLNINDKTFIIQSGEYSKVIRKTDIEFDQNSGYITNFNSQSIKGKDIIQYEQQAPLEIKQLVSKLKTEQEKQFSEVIIENNTYQLNGKRDDIRYRETNLGNLSADALYWKAQQTVNDLNFAFTNGGGIRSSIEPGKITKKHTYDVFPFPNTLVVNEAKGSVIRQVFDKASVSNNGSGAFLHFSEHVKLTQNQDKSWTYEIKNTQTNEFEQLNDEKVYKFATNDFLIAGGDGYDMLKNLKQLYSGPIIKEVFEEFLQKLNNENGLEKYKQLLPRQRWLFFENNK